MFLFRLIPEPWATALLAVAIFVAYAYGNVTGKGTERLRNTVANLEVANKSLTRDFNNAIAIQTAIADRASVVRAENEILKAKGDDLEEYFKSRVCVLSDADRLRIQSIRITPQPGSRAR